MQESYFPALKHRNDCFLITENEMVFFASFNIPIWHYKWYNLCSNISCEEIYFSSIFASGGFGF